jgi:hypothetical protein
MLWSYVVLHSFYSIETIISRKTSLMQIGGYIYSLTLSLLKTLVAVSLFLITNAIFEHLDLNTEILLKTQSGL